MAQRNWLIHPSLPKEMMEQNPDIDPVVLQLLYNRGITTSETATRFLNPKYENLSSPFALTDMHFAVIRIFQAIANEEKIAIYADYDADAVTACAVVYRALLTLTGNPPEVYIPDRFAEGYGLNLEAMESLSAQGVKLIITVDCGINAVSEIKRARELGMDVVVTDHHHITGALPDTVAVVNPKRDQISDLDGLTGVGVAFKLVQAIFFSLFPEQYSAHSWSLPDEAREAARTANGFILPTVRGEWEKWLLDLVAIGTVADCQSLLGENRVLVAYGLRVLSKTRWVGLRLIAQMSGINLAEANNTFTIGFVIAPRINAAGRIQHADIAFRLLATDDPAEAARYAGQMESLNQHRQRLTEQVVSEARSQVELQLDRKVLLAVGERWPKGVVGLVAGRLAEEFYRPTVVLEISESIASGSARSVAGFNIVEAFGEASDHLMRFGGHAQAAGLTLAAEHIPLFHQALIDRADRDLDDADLVRTETADMEISLGRLNLELAERLMAFEPTGAGNPPPRFLIRGLSVESMRTVGNNNSHLKVHASQNGSSLELIGFRQAYRLQSVVSGDKVDVIVEPSINLWNGRRSVQCKIIDLKKI